MIVVSLATLSLGACATMPPEQAEREAIWLQAARECESRFATIRVKQIDSYGRLWLELWQGAQYEVAPFEQCWKEKVEEQMRSPAKQIAPTGRPPGK